MHQAKPVNERFRQYIATIAATDSLRPVALKANMEPSTLGRQLDGTLKVETVVAIARAYDAPLLHAFVAAGFISQDEANDAAALSTLTSASDRQLAEEILRRVIEAEEMHPELTNPLTMHESDDVSGLPEDDVQSRYATAANTDFSADDLDPDTP